MNCFECAKVQQAVPAVGVCQHCGVGLCMDHFAEARDYRVGGTVYSCGHTMPPAKRLRRVPAGIAATTGRDRAGVA